MQIQVNTDHNIHGGEAMLQRVKDVLNDVLSRFSPQLTRVEVHFKDHNSDKKSGAQDKRCMLEARPAGHPPIAVSHEAPTVWLALDGASEKLVHSLDHTLGRLGRH